VDDARRADDLISGITLDVQPANGAADIQRERPGLDAGERPDQLGMFEIQLNPAQFRQFADLPDHDRRNTPRVSGEKRGLPPCQIIGESVEEDVRVEIEHPT